MKWIYHQILMTGGFLLSLESFRLPFIMRTSNGNLANVTSPVRRSRARVRVACKVQLYVNEAQNGNWKTVSKANTGLYRSVITKDSSQTLIIMSTCRDDLNTVLEVMLCEDSSSDSPSSDEDELDFLVCEFAFNPKRMFGPRLNLLDLSNLQCEQLFRYL